MSNSKRTNTSKEKQDFNEENTLSMRAEFFQDQEFQRPQENCLIFEKGESYSSNMNTFYDDCDYLTIQSEYNKEINENKEEKDKYCSLFDCIKIDEAKDLTILGDSKTSTSSAFTEEDDPESKVILDDDEMIFEKDFLNKKRKRRIKKTYKK